MLGYKARARVTDNSYEGGKGLDHLDLNSHALGLHTVNALCDHVHDIENDLDSNEDFKDFLNLKRKYLPL